MGSNTKPYMFLLDTNTQKLVEAETIKGTIKDMPLKKIGWTFN